MIIRELLTLWGFKIDVKALERLNKRVGEVKKTVDDTTEHLRNLGQGMRDVGGKMTLYGTLPILGFLGASVKTAGEFEKSMNRVAAVTKIFDITDERFTRLTQRAKELGKTTPFAASEVGNAMEFMGMAGQSAVDIYDNIPHVLDLAGAAQLDFGRSADIVTNIMSGMQLKNEDLTHAVDVLTMAFTSANTNLEQLGQAMKFAGNLSSLSNISFEETTASLAALGNVGIQSTMAGRGLRQALIKMLNPTRDAQKVFKALNVQFKDAQNNPRKLLDVLEDLQKAGATPGQIVRIFDSVGGTVANSLMTIGINNVREFKGQLEDVDGLAAMVQKTQWRGLAGTVKKVGSAMEAAAIAIADSGLLEVVVDVFEGIAGVIRKLAAASPTLLRIMTIIGIMVAMLGPLIGAFGTLISMAVGIKALQIAMLAMNAQLGVANLLAAPLTLAFWGITAAVLGVIAAIVLLVDDLLVFGRGGKSITGLLIEGFEKAAEKIKEAFSFKGIFDGLVAPLKWLDEKAGSLLNMSKGFSAGLLEAVTGNDSLKSFSDVVDGTSAALAPEAGIKAMNRSTGSGKVEKKIEVKANINMAVPPGTPEEQQKVIQDSAERAVEVAIDRRLRDASAEALVLP